VARHAEAGPDPAAKGSQRLQRAWLSRGPWAWALLPIAALFAALVACRRALYAAGWLHAQCLSVPVVVVGNLIVGGAGKTPTVMAVVSALRRHGFTPGVISRGYGRDRHAVVDVERSTPVAACGDEPLLMRIRLDAPVVVARDRVAAARSLLRRHPGVDVIVSDDGLQHLRLARDAQVLVFDERGIGNGWLLPAGPLREPMPPTAPPRSIVLYNAAQASTNLPGHLAHRALKGVVPLGDWWAGRAASMAALDALATRRVVAAAGMAQPARFFDMLRDAGLDIDALPLPDHHAFSTLPWPEDTHDVVVTEKDAVKLDPARLAATQVWVAPLDFHIDAAFEAALLELLPQSPTRTPDGHPIA
jgi:tetraacyldisaccharide 4'-kinase